jgi:CHAT domain-containing protein/tetratricopeptide (TPR) repeat protein
MRRILPYIIILMLSLPTLAQSGDELVKQAQAAQKSGESAQALTLWSQAGEALGNEGNKAGQGLCLFYKAILEYKGKQLEAALTSLDEAEAIFSDLGRDDGVALVRLQSGAVLLEAKRFPDAEQAYQEAVVAARRHGDPERLGEALKHLAEIFDTQHRWNEAYDAYRQLLDLQLEQQEKLKAADTLVTMGAIRQLQTMPDEAELHYRRALEIFGESKQSELAAEVVDRLSRLYLGRMDWTKAEKNLLQAIESHTANGFDDRQAIARANLGYALESQNRFSEATEQYRASSALFEQLGNADQVLQVSRQLVKALALSGDEKAAAEELETLFPDNPLKAGQLCLELGWDQKAETYFQLALTSTTDSSERAKLLNRLGMMAARRTELNRARELFVESLALARENSDSGLAASVLNNLGENYQSSGRYSAAEPCYLEALEFFRASKNPSGEAYALSNLGTLKFGQGDYGQALKYLGEARSKALDPDTFGGPHRLQGTILNAMGLVHQFLGRSDDAKRLYFEALAVRRSVHDERGEIVTLNNIAAMFSEGDAPKTAERNYLLALELSERRNDPSHQAQLHNNLGQVQAELGREDEARASYQKALVLYRTQGMLDGEAITLDNLGHLADDPEQAADYHGQAVSLLEKVGNRQSLATALLNLGGAQADMGDKAAAIKTLTRSVNLLDELALALSPSDKSSFLGKNQEAYHTLVRLLLEEDRTDEAFRVNERARARALLDILGGRSVPIRNAPGELLAREEHLRARIRDMLASPMTKSNRERLTSLKQDYGTLLTEVARLDPGGADLRSTDIAKIKDLAEALGPDRALLEYFVLDEQTYLLLLVGGELTALELPIGEDELSKTISKWRRSLPIGGDPQLAQNLGQVLIEPALEELAGVEDLIIVPHKALHYLPFSALQVSDQRLIEQFELTTAPSASAWLLGQRKSAEDGRFSAAALGNVGLNLSGGPSSGATRSLEFLPLPGTLDEIKAVTRLFPDGTWLVEEDLTTANLRKVSAKSGTLHVATHGVLDAEVPIFSGLVTADGLVTVADVLEWEKTPNLVVLSACETALGELGEGDDLVGLTRAFQAGGTRCMVATLWPVSDESTSLWMTTFYDGLKNDQTVAQASATATRALRQTHSSPYYWAPFVVLGDGAVKMH